MVASTTHVEAIKQISFKTSRVAQIQSQIPPTRKSNIHTSLKSKQGTIDSSFLLTENQDSLITALWIASGLIASLTSSPSLVKELKESNFESNLEAIC